MGRNRTSRSKAGATKERDAGGSDSGSRRPADQSNHPASGTHPPASGTDPRAGAADHLRYLAVVLLLAALVLQVLPPLFNKSGVCDEHGAHLPSGYVYLKSGVFSGGVNNPPLMQVLAAAPLVLGGLDYTPFSDSGLPAARIPVLVLSLALALLVFVWAKTLYGRAAGLAALFLYCFEPNVLAHSGLATLDLGVTTFLFGAFFFLWRASHSKRPANWMVACAAMCLALLSKFTALLVLPVFLFLLVAAVCRSGDATRRTRGDATRLVGRGDATGKAHSDDATHRVHKGGATRLVGRVDATGDTSCDDTTHPVHRGGAKPHARKGDATRLVRSALAALAFMAALFVATSHLAYHLPAASGGAGSVQRIEQPPSRTGDSTVPRAARFLLPDLYVQGAVGKLRHSEGGHFAYLMGKRSLQGWWYYFPVALALKTPIPFLLALLFSLILGAGLKGRSWDAVFLLLPIVSYMCAMAWTGVDIGVRHVLLFYPFGAVIGSGLLARGLPRKKFLFALVALGAVWHLAGALRVHPHYLAYFNEAASGPRGGARYLIDSNIDWGQDENLLVRFVSREPDTVLVNPGPYAPSAGTIAVNVNSLRGILKGDDSAYRWLRAFEPVETLGYTWYVYRLGADDYGRLALESGPDPEPRFWHAIALRKEGRLHEGLDKLQEIARGFPEESARCLLTAGRWLIEAGRLDEAIAALRGAVASGGGEDAQEMLQAAVTERKWARGEATPEELAGLAQHYIGRRKERRAREALQAGIELAPADAALRLEMARLLAKEGDFEAAVRYAESAAEVASELKAAKQISEEARRLVAMEKARGDFEAAMLLGRFHNRYGRPATAARHYWRAFNIDPSSEAALSVMGDIIVRTKLGVVKLEAPWPPWPGL